ncbi:MAG: hypothetical protein ACYT04_76780 [Nostoc sp.]
MINITLVSHIENFFLAPQRLTVCVALGANHPRHCFYAPARKHPKNHLERSRLKSLPRGDLF